MSKRDKTKSKPKAPRPAATPSGWRLMQRAWRDLWAHRWTYLRIAAVVVVPASLLGMIASLANDAGFNAYVAAATLVMSVALTWAMVEIARGGKAPTVAAAYYRGTATFVQYVIVALWLTLMLIPAAIGAVIFLLGAAPPPGVLVTASDAIALDIIAILVSTPSLWLLTRFSLAPYAVIQDGLRPMVALRLSRRLTLRRFWRVAGRMAFLLVIGGLMALTVYVPVLALGLVLHNEEVLMGLYTLLISLVVWPFANLYLLKLYRDLVKTQPAS